MAWTFTGTRSRRSAGAIIVRDRARSGSTERSLTGPLDSEGLITTARNPGAFQSVAVPFAVYHHMPTPTAKDAGPVTIDPDEFDFHQALSSLESHPELLRALGLVFDVELPVDLVPQTVFPAFSTLSLESTSFRWQMPPASHAARNGLRACDGGRQAASSSRRRGRRRPVRHPRRSWACSISTRRTTASRRWTWTAPCTR